MIHIKRAYEKPSPKDGRRILVDRLWPRGVSKENLKLYAWEKDLAPSTALRKWFAHDPKKWEGFERKYRAELKKSETLSALRKEAKKHTITLIYAAKDEAHNEAVILAKLLK